MDVRTILLLSALILLLGCTTAARRDMKDDRAAMHRQPLELRGDAGVPAATIAVDGQVSIGKEPVPTTEAQRGATLDYRAASLALADMSFDTADHLTKFAVPRLLLSSIVHGFDGASRGIEADAQKATHTPAFCSSLDQLRQKQDAMVAEVERLRPYARLTQEDVLDCRAGRPYRHSI